MRSVVRPLSTALGGAAESAAAPSLEGEAGLAEALHEVVLDATRLRLRTTGAPALEATAALQDLACQAVA